MLESLRVVTYGRGRLEELIVSRAAAELRPGGPAQSGIDWDYWIARWPTMKRVDRKRTARLEIVPRLTPPKGARASADPAWRTDPPGHPAARIDARGGAPPRASPAPPPCARGEPAEVPAAELPDWLRQVRQKHCQEDRE